VLRVNRDDQITSGVGAAEHTDSARRLSNVIRYGKVKEADYAKALIRVELQDGELVSDWIPWITLRAGKDKFWWAPEVGEVMLLLAPSGELANAVALPAAFSNENQNADRATVQRQTFDDGTVVEYDREAHRLSMDVKGDVKIKATGRIDIEADGDVKIIGARIDLNP
jgi:phage baseplate assembly protein V